MFSTLAISGSHGLFGTDWVRFHAVRVEGGIVLQTLTGAVLPNVPTRFINSGQMVRLVAESGKRTNMAAVPDSIVKAGRKAYDGWKVELSLDELCSKFGVTDADKTLLVATYMEDEAVAA